jgi:hypothetical protein
MKPKFCGIVFIGQSASIEVSIAAIRLRLALRSHMLSLCMREEHW